MGENTVPLPMSLQAPAIPGLLATPLQSPAVLQILSQPIDGIILKAMNSRLAPIAEEKHVSRQNGDLIARGFTIASESRLIEGIPIILDLGDQGKCRIELRGGKILVTGADGAAIPNNIPAYSTICEVISNPIVAAALPEGLAGRIEAKTLHYEVSATVYDTKKGKEGKDEEQVIFSNIATIVINPDTGEVTDRSSTKTEQPGLGTIKWSLHFGHTGLIDETSDDFKQRTAADRMAIYLRGMATGEWVPETIISRVSEGKFAIVTIAVTSTATMEANQGNSRAGLNLPYQGGIGRGVKPSARDVAALENEVGSLIKGCTPEEAQRMMVLALSRLSIQELMKMAQPKAGSVFLSNVLESPEFADAFTIAVAVKAAGLNALPKTGCAAWIDARGGREKGVEGIEKGIGEREEGVEGRGFALSEMIESFKLLSRNIPVKFYVVIADDNDGVPIKGVTYIKSPALDMNFIMAEIARAQEGIEPSNIAAGFIDNKDSIESVKGYFKAADGKAGKMFNLLMAKGDIFAANAKANKKVPALTILSLLAKLATTASDEKDKIIFTAVGYDNENDLAVKNMRNILGKLCAFILIKAKDIGREISTFITRLTATGRSL